MAGEEHITQPSNSECQTRPEQNAASSVQNVHPFFSLQPTKRTSVSTCHDDRECVTRSSSYSIKRHKKKSSSHKPKSAKIHSFFKVNTSRIDSASVTQEMEQLACEANETTDAGGDCVASSEVELVSTDVFNEEYMHDHQGSQQRSIFRLPEIPAPYPTGETHVPTPGYVRYSSTICTTGFERCRHIQAQKIDAADILSRHGYSQSTHPDRQDKGFDIHSYTMEERTPKLEIPEFYVLKASIAPVKCVLGKEITLLPQHMSFLKPILDAINSDLSCSKPQKAELLASRYRPKQTCHVLSNRQAASQLRSWIEGMRIKRMGQAQSDETSGRIALSETADSTNSRVKNITSVYNTKISRGFRSRCSDSDESYSYSRDNYDSESSDDFVPTRLTKRSHPPKRDDLRDVLAWSRSNGTLNSIRDNMYVGARHKRNGSGATSSSEPESLSNMVLLAGPSGSCKTATVYACAEECNFEVYEIHPGQRRSGKDVLSMLEDALLSHTIATTSNGPHVKPDADANQMLILVEQIDVLFEQDQRLWPALKQLALRGRRPIVLTCNDLSCIRWDEACFQHVFHFQLPRIYELVPYMFFLCLAEGALVSPSSISRACNAAKCDINRLFSSLEIAIRNIAPQRHNVSTGGNMNLENKVAVPHFAEWENINLEGTIAWILGPLTPQETPESRFNFWIELVSSATCSEDAGSWYEKLPDLLPSRPIDPGLAEKESSTHPSAYHNRFFAPDVPCPTNHSVENIVDVLNPQDVGLYVTHSVIPMSASNHGYTRSGGCVNESPLVLPLSSLEEIEPIADALDILSFAYATTDTTEIHSECLYEPLYSYKKPMSDGCLSVSYITLDEDVLSSKNPRLLADGFGVDRYGVAGINGFLKQAAFNSLQKVNGSQQLVNSMAPFQGLSGLGKPRSLYGTEERLCCTARELYQAVGYAGIDFRCHILPKLTLDTASFLANMVFWDWVFLKKLDSSVYPDCVLHQERDDDANGYRTGARRTRRSAYRAHIKHMPESTQKLLVSWITLQLRNK